MHWFETELLTREENLIGLMTLKRETLRQAKSLDGTGRVVLDMDSSKSPVMVNNRAASTTGTSSQSATTVVSVQ